MASFDKDYTGMHGQQNIFLKCYILNMFSSLIEWRVLFWLLRISVHIVFRRVVISKHSSVSWTVRSDTELTVH